MYLAFLNEGAMDSGVPEPIGQWTPVVGSPSLLDQGGGLQCWGVLAFWIRGSGLPAWGVLRMLLLYFVPMGTKMG